MHLEVGRIEIAFIAEIVFDVILLRVFILLISVQEHFNGLTCYFKASYYKHVIEHSQNQCLVISSHSTMPIISTRMQAMCGF